MGEFDMHIIEGKHQSLQRLVLATIFSFVVFLCMAATSLNINAATSFDKALSSTQFQNISSAGSTSTTGLDSSRSAVISNLTGSGVQFQRDEGPFYAGDSIPLIAQTKVQGTGNYFSNGHAKIFIDKSIFSSISPTDIANSADLKNAPTITSDSNNYIINLDFKTVASGSPVGIPFFLHFKPGAVTNLSNYSIPIEYTDDSGNVIYTNKDFKVQAKTDAPKLWYVKSGMFKLDYTHWDGDKLKEDFKPSYVGNGLIYNKHTEHGEYTIKLKLPEGYKVGVIGDGVYNQIDNTITSHMTLNQGNLAKYGTDYQDDSFDFSIVYPAGTPAGTTLPLEYTLTGPSNATAQSTIGIDKDGQPTPYFNAWNGKTAMWNNSSSSLTTDEVTDKTPVVTTLTPVKLSSLDGLNSQGKTGDNYAEVTSVTDTPETTYPMNRLEMVDTDALSQAFKDKLNDNTVTATLDGKSVSLGSLQYGKPIELHGKPYQNITVKFNSPVRFDAPSQTKFQIKITGNVTQKVIDDFKKSSDSKISWTNDISTAYSETSEDKTSKSNVYHNPETSKSEFNLTKPAPPEVPEPIIIFYNWQGLKIISNNDNNILGEQPFTAQFNFSIAGNKEAKIQPKNGKFMLVVPDGIVLASPNAAGLANLKMFPNYQGRGQTAIIGDIVNLDDYVNEPFTGVTYSISLKGNPDLVANQYRIDGYLAVDNNNWKVFPKTDFHIFDHDRGIWDFGLYQNTNDPDSRFSDSQNFNYVPGIGSLNINKVSIKDKSTGEYGRYVSDTGQSLYPGDELKYESSIINNGQTPYNHLDLIDVWM